VRLALLNGEMMPTKTTGLELQAFYNDDDYWKNAPGQAEGFWHEEIMLEVNGKEVPEDFSIANDLQPDDQVVIIDGTVLSSIPNVDAQLFESFFKKWRKVQSIGYLAVEAPKDKLDAIKAAIRAAGGKVV
jgi:hypothetical protein